MPPAADRLERSLRLLLGEATYARNAAVIRAKMVDEDGAPVAAELIERVAR